MALQSPVTSDQLQQLDDNLQLLTDLDQEIARAQRAGIDVSNLRAQAQDLRTQMNKLKSAYGKPGG